MDVACSLNLDLIQNVPVLSCLGDDCMAALVTKLKPLQVSERSELSLVKLTEK